MDSSGDLPFDTQQRRRNQTKFVDFVSRDHIRKLDHLLRSQGEALSAALRRQRNLHLHSMAMLLDSRASALMKQKEEELALACQTMAELEQRLRGTEEESRAWKRLAKEYETVALVLNNAIHRILSGSAAENSRCEGSSSEFVGGGEDGEVKNARGRCRICGSQDLKLVFLPCMHLSACNLCGPLLASCPVCNSVKQETLEVFLP